MIYTSDTILNAARVEDIEAILLKLVRSTKRVEAPQQQHPADKLQSESDKNYVADFIEKIKLILPQADVDILAPRTTETGKLSDDIIDVDSERFILNGAESDAAAEIVGDQWIVLANSLARIKETKAISGTYNETIRHKLLDEGLLIVEGENYRFTVDRAFRSPSQAAEMVLGRSTNGRAEWKHATTG